MVYQEEDYRLEPMSILLFYLIHQLVLPLFLVVLLPLQFLLLRRLEGLHFPITLIRALAQTFTLVKNLYSHDYDRSFPLPQHSHHLLRFQPFKPFLFAHRPPSKVFSVA